MDALTLANIRKWDDTVAADPQYGKEQELIGEVIRRYPANTDLTEVAMKVSVIDLTNSTQLTNYKSRLSLYDIAEIITTTADFDLRVAAGDVQLVSDLAATCKQRGVNLLSFASKYCFYHNVFAHGRCDYSIFDSVVSQNLYRVATTRLPLRKTQPEKWRNDIDYQAFHKYIGDLLDEYGITGKVKNRRQMFDHFMWFANR